MSLPPAVPLDLLVLAINICKNLPMKIPFLIYAFSLILFSCDSQKNAAPKVSPRANWAAEEAAKREAEEAAKKAAEGNPAKPVDHADSSSTSNSADSPTHN